jgi:ATP-binding cassette subfamily C protein
MKFLLLQNNVSVLLFGAFLLYGPLRMLSSVLKSFVSVVVSRPLAKTFVVASTKYIKQIIFTHPLLLKNISPSEISSAIIQAQDSFSGIIYILFFLLLPSIISMISVLVMIALRLGIKYLIILLAYLAVYFWITKRNSKKVISAQKGFNKLNLNLASKVAELFGARDFIFTNDAICFEEESLEEDLLVRAESEINLHQKLEWFGVQQFLVAGIAISLIIIFAYFDYQGVSLNAERLLIIILAQNKFISPISESTRLIRNLGKHFSLMGNFERLLKLSETQEAKILELPKRCSGEALEKNSSLIFSKIDSIQLKNIHLTCGSKKIFVNLNYNLKTSGLIVVTGKNGVGKTTFLKMLLGLDLPKEGLVVLANCQNEEIFLDKINWCSRNKLFSYVEQNPILMNESIEWNLFYGIETTFFDKQMIKSVSEFVGEKLWGKFNFWVGSCGKNLSKGDIEKIRIAQAILKDSEILFLDEPTNNLDQKSQALLLTLLLNISKKRTLIIATHNQLLIDKASHNIKLESISGIL